MNKNINLCQPNDKISCVACCGLLNHSDISYRNLTRFLQDGQFRTENSWRYQIDGCYPEQTTSCRDKFSYICPFQGFISPGRPGCLIHPLYLGKDQRDMALFGEMTCNNFSCHAYTLFNDEAKNIIIENIDDWYLYTIAIIDPISIIWILEQMHKANLKSKTEKFKNKFILSLKTLGEIFDKYQDIIFCYSFEEYNLLQKKFSLTADNDESKNNRQQILQIIESNE